MKPTLIKLDDGLWIKPSLVMIIGADQDSNVVQITFENKVTIQVQNKEARHGTLADEADMIAAMVNGTGN